MKAKRVHQGHEYNQSSISLFTTSLNHVNRTLQHCRMSHHHYFVVPASISWAVESSAHSWGKKHLALQIQEQFCGGAPFGSNIKRLSLEVSTPLECEYANVFLSKACGKEIATASNCWGVLGKFAPLQVCLCFPSTCWDKQCAVDFEVRIHSSRPEEEPVRASNITRKEFGEPAFCIAWCRTLKPGSTSMLKREILQTQSTTTPSCPTKEAWSGHQLL